LLLIVLLLLQEVGVENPGPLTATITLKNQKSMVLTDFKIKGPDPYFMTINRDEGTEFLPIYYIDFIEKTARSYWFELHLVSQETFKGQVKSITFEGFSKEDDQGMVTVKLSDIANLKIISDQQLKSCPHCEYEAQTAYWFCPRCGGSLDLGGYSQNLPKETRQQPLIRYRIDTRDQ